MGRRDLRDDTLHSLLRARPRRTRALRSRLHRPRARHDASRGTHPRASRAPSLIAAPRASTRARSAGAIPAGAASALGGEVRLGSAQARRRRRRAELPSSLPGCLRRWALELMEAIKMDAHELYIDGKWTTGSSERTIDVLNPATGETIATAPDAGPEEVDRAVRAARRAFTSWREVTAQERGRILFRLAEWVRKEHARLAKLE